MNKQEAQASFEAGHNVNVTFKAATRSHCRKATRRITGFDPARRVKCEYHGWPGFVVRDSEVISFEIVPHTIPLKRMAVVCRRWFQTSCGNTYHSVMIRDAATGKIIAHEPFEYGYDRQCVQTAADMLTKLGYRVSCSDLEARIACLTITDVNRKKDL